ncbi:MAG: hypothetical protein U0325_08100 [Polyangiales bacterium]
MTHDPHDGMSPAARALLRHAPTPRPRTPAERARTSAAVRRIAAAPAVATGVWFGWKGLALASALVLGGVALATRPRPAPTPPRATLPARTPAAPAPTLAPPATPAPSVHTDPADHTGPSAPTRPRRVAAPRETRGPAPLAAPLAPPLPAPTPPRPETVVSPTTPAITGTAVAPPPEDEVRTLERARATLQRDPTEALRIVEGISASERFAEERALIAMEAERRLGHTDALQRRATRFLSRFPQSLYAERVRRWVGAPPAAPPGP